MSKLNARTVIALVAVGLVAVVGVTAAIVAYAVSKAPDSAPVVTVYGGGETVEAEPFGYCNLATGACENFEHTYYLLVPSGDPVQVSLPSAIAEAPWVVLQRFERPSGEREDRVMSWLDFPEGVRALSIDTQPAPDLRLIGFEVQLPMIYTDPATGQETTGVHGAWSIGTPAP
ncbi:hypothetical protein NN3_13850 [Nocardia neocaledoniensis NBRC 108232]|uniref:Uncharacterized protein DUF2771 n=1 Tax=Nocardia neocaledoniensis TaxID=236511 RepID=A0A317NRP7_9NOCA|nr:DUF2771 family protein [Nocardia neocaledoniensis]PWV77919.1 uncharacterized protein DUF2771 [Nocardia neocaledoniensis]GEM30378.1 hypothetical protein NN3_13850 [Nocardia neocaledoniensis NBRC 108232]